MSCSVPIGGNGRTRGQAKDFNGPPDYLVESNGYAGATVRRAGIFHDAPIPSGIALLVAGERADLQRVGIAGLRARQYGRAGSRLCSSWLSDRSPPWIAPKIG